MSGHVSFPIDPGGVPEGRPLPRTYHKLICWPRFVSEPRRCRKSLTTRLHHPCYRLFPEPGIEEAQRLGPDPFCLPRATPAGALRREGPAIRAAGRATLAAACFLRPRGASWDDLNSVRTAEGCRQVLTTVLGRLRMARSRLRGRARRRAGPGPIAHHPAPCTSDAADQGNQVTESEQH